MTLKTCTAFVVLFGMGLVAVGCGETDGSQGSSGAPTTSSSSSGGSSSGSSGTPTPSCPAPKGGPTEHVSTIVADETWTADKSPHVVPYDLAIQGATLTIEPCAEVIIGGVRTLTIATGGKLVAEGKENLPIRIHGQDPSKAFAQIYANGGGSMRLAYVEIENGGDPQNSIEDITGTIYVQGDQYLPTQPLVFVDHVTMKASLSNGLYMSEGAGFAPGSRDLTVTGSAQYPISITPPQLDTIPTGKYTGHATDEHLLPAGRRTRAIQVDATMHERGVPYRVGNSNGDGMLLVERPEEKGGFATLTIEPGVTIRFKKEGFLSLDRFTGQGAARGAIVAVGTPAKPIVFTSAEAKPVAGDWLGLFFNEIPQASNRIEYARIDYAGGVTQEGSATCNTQPSAPDAAVRIFGVPQNQFVKNTKISNSAGHGIDRGWRADSVIDFMATNEFVGVAACKQTLPSAADGSCPQVVPCPK